MLEWREDTIPYSTRFGDAYFSHAGGLEETGHVFIGWNDLPARWPAMDHCTIAELGFGTSLNFLETVRQWQGLRQPGATLTFISFELFPMSPYDMAHALSRWPQLAHLSPALISHWRDDAELLQVRPFDGVELVVLFSDAATRLPMMEFTADAWYLDGFAPARNPAMWSAELMQAVFDRTGPGGTFATYTSAGWVRRNLQAAGFTVEKQAGFAGKREMLRGYRPA